MSDIHFSYHTCIPIRFADIDAFGHVNNAVFLTYFEIARSAYLDQSIGWNWKKDGLIIARAEIDYIRPVMIEDNLKTYVRTSRTGTTSFDLEYLLVRVKDGAEETCAKGMTVCVCFDYSTNKPALLPGKYRDRMD